MLHTWHDIFHNLRSEKREQGWSVALAIQIADAVKLQRKFGLTVTPRVKRISNADKRALSKAERIWIEINAEAQKRIQAVRKDGARQSKKEAHRDNPIELCGRPAWDICYSSTEESEEETDDQYLHLIATSNSHLTPVRASLFGNDDGDDDANDQRQGGLGRYQSC